MEGGPKVFFMASVWQILNTFTETGGSQNKTADSIKHHHNVRSEGNYGWKSEWVEKGQPIVNWPKCSMYNSRCDADPALADDMREYHLNLDVDGKNSCSEWQLENHKCESEITLYEEGDTDGGPPRLSIIGDAVKDAIREETGLVTYVSWHKRRPPSTSLSLHTLSVL